MPRTTSKSALFAKYGTKLVDAHQNHVNDETELGFMDLPAGIENGIAQLVDCRFGQFKEGDNKGEWYFLARGSVIEPKVFKDIPIEGLFTSIGPEPVCDTPTRSRKTVDAHIKWIYDEMDKLGMKREDIDPENLEEAAQALKEAAPYFRFRTWKGRKQTEGKYANQEPRTQHSWMGLVAYESDDGDAPGADDASGDSEPPQARQTRTQADGSARNGTHQESAHAQRQTGAVARPAARRASPPPAPEPEPEQAFRDDDDVESLVDRAGAQDEDAILKLTEFALAAGYSEEEVANADSWSDVLDMINNPREAGDEGEAGEAGEEGETGDDTEVVIPAKGEHWNYVPRDKNGKVGKTVPVEVIKVDADNQVCDVRSMKDKKVIKAVPFEQLESNDS